MVGTWKDIGGNMKQLSFEELNKRADEVFLLDEGDLIVSVDGNANATRVRIYNEISGLEWDLMPDMSERPQALDYLMGKRDNFND